MHRWSALCGTVYCVTRKPRHYHFSDDDRLRLHRYFGTRVGEIYVKINLKRCMNTTISGSLYSTRPLPLSSPSIVPPIKIMFPRKLANFNVITMVEKQQLIDLSFSRVKKKLLCRWNCFGLQCFHTVFIRYYIL